MLQLALVFDIILRTFIWTSAVAITLFWGARDERLFTRWLSYDMHVWTDAVRVARDLFTLIVVFNMAYLLMLMIVRLPVARIKSGHYRFDDPGLGFALFRNCILGALVRARYQPPFPAFLVPQLAGIVPFRWLLGRQFGPDTKSSFWGEPMILDPSLVKIGRNVLIGYGSVLTGHMVTRDEARVGEIIIEDDVLIGGYVGIGCDVHIGRGAAVGPGSFVLPGTRIGENEYWNGRPARRVRDVPDLGQPRQDDSPQTGSTNP
jgi:hypothetical protein